MVGTRWSKFAVVFALAAAFVACFAAVSGAEGEEDTGGFGAFRLKGTNGYSILVMGFSRAHYKQGKILVLATKGHAAVTYFTPATVTATTIEADLGDVGEVALEFQPEGAPERVRSSCEENGSVTFQPGFWVGKIEVTGEEGFTTAQKTRAKAIVTPFLDILCGASAGGEGVGRVFPGARLVVRDREGHRARFLQVNQNRPGGPLRIEAHLEEKRGDLIIDHSIEGLYLGSGLHFDPKLRSATLSPPPPFSGSATFHRNAKPANRWTGNLTLDFPGRANVPMAGRAFKTTLVHARWSKG